MFEVGGLAEKKPYLLKKWAIVVVVHEDAIGIQGVLHIMTKLKLSPVFSSRQKTVKR